MVLYSLKLQLFVGHIRFRNDIPFSLVCDFLTISGVSYPDRNLCSLLYCMYYIGAVSNHAIRSTPLSSVIVSKIMTDPVAQRHHTFSVRLLRVEH